MSQTAESQAATRLVSDPSRSPDAAAAFFEQAIWHNRFVCSECFRRMQRQFAGHFEGSDGHLVDIDHVWRTDDATLGERHDEPPASVASVQPLPRPRTTCECGSVGGVRQSATLSTAAARERVPRLAERLREQGYAVDEHAMDVAVAHLKTSEWRGYDKEVFAVATALGVSKA